MGLDGEVLASRCLFTFPLQPTMTTGPLPLLPYHADRANFEFGNKADSRAAVAASRGRRRRGEGRGVRRGGNEEAAWTCDAVNIELRIWFDTMSTAGPVSSFLQRQLTCFAILVLIFTIRATLRRCQMLYYPDDPAPPDMAFPGVHTCAPRCLPVHKLVLSQYNSSLTLDALAFVKMIASCFVLIILL